MHLGHRGANHPVKNLITKKVEITSQNHGFKVEANNLITKVKITHTSLFDKSIEGIEIKNIPINVSYKKNIVSHFRPFIDFLRISINSN